MNGDELRYALRAEAARRQRENWKDELSAACGTKVGDKSFLNTDATAAIKAAFISALRARPSTATMSWPRDDPRRIHEYISRFRADALNMSAVLFHSRDAFFGAVWIPVKDVLEHAFEVWRIVGEDLALCTADVANGLCLEENFYDLDGRYAPNGVFEFTGWGAFTPQPT